MALCVLLFAAQQEILFGAAAFQQVAAQPVDLIRGRARVRGEHPIAFLRSLTGQIDAADQREAAKANGADRCNLVRDTDTNAEPHEYLPGIAGSIKG